MAHRYRVRTRSRAALRRCTDDIVVRRSNSHRAEGPADVVQRVNARLKGLQITFEGLQGGSLCVERRLLLLHLSERAALRLQDGIDGGGYIDATS
jgi:hypothetical protein